MNHDWTVTVMEITFFTVVYTMCEKEQTLQALVIGYHMHFLRAFERIMINLDTTSTSDLKSVSSDVGTEGSAEHKDTAGSILGSTSTTKGNVSEGVDGALLVTSALWNTKGNLLSINFDGSTRFLSTGETSVNPTESNSVAADSKTALQ
jgi:hypothetical protein